MNDSALPSSEPNAGEGTIRFLRFHELPGVEVMDVTNVARQWAYFHETYTFCVGTAVEEDRDVPWKYRLRTHTMRVDGVQLMEPGEFHANLWCAPRATFRVVQVAPEVMSELARRSGWTSGGPIHFTKAQLYGGPIRARLKQLTHVLVDEPDLEGADYALHGLLDDLDEHGCLEARRPSASPLKCWNRIRRARELIESKWNKPLTLAEILATSGLTKDTLYRRFREDYGTTPKAYHNHVRLLRAKDMLLRPEASLADTAKQCRLTFTRFLRMFEKEFGVAPLEYMSAVGTLGRSSQIVPVPLERTEHVSSPEPSRARIHPNPADANRNRA